MSDTIVSAHFIAMYNQSSWKRATDVPHPITWFKFKAKDLEGDELVDFRVQNLTENRFDDVFKLQMNEAVDYLPPGKTIGN